MPRLKQETLPGTDTELSKAADKVLTCKDDFNKAREELDTACEEMLAVMDKARLHKVRHGGQLFKRVTIESKEKLRIKSDSED